MNILERFPIDTIRRFVANRLGVNPKELSMDYRCLTLEASSISPESIRVYGGQARAIVPIGFSMHSTAVQNDGKLEVKLSLDNRTCDDMFCYLEVYDLVHFTTWRAVNENIIMYDDEINPFNMREPQTIAVAKGSCYFSALSDFCIFEGQLLPMISLSSNEVIDYSSTVCKFEYLEFGIS